VTDVKLLNWLADQNSPTFIENPDHEIAPLLRKRLEELSAISVIEIMVPRPLINALDADVQLRRVRRLKSAKVSHFPVFKGDLDKILGWVEKSKVIALLTDAREDQKLEDFVQPIPRISELAKVPELTDLFIQTPTPFVVVTNSQGVTVGLVTLEEFVAKVFGFDVRPQQASPALAEGPGSSPSL
jgi:CBS domain containing-hemolysin-like protein